MNPPGSGPVLLCPHTHVLALGELYASLMHINAYNQPGVEAGKKTAAALLTLQSKTRTPLSSTPQTAEQIAVAVGAPELGETVHFVLEHLAVDGKVDVKPVADPSAAVFTAARASSANPRA